MSTLKPKTQALIRASRRIANTRWMKRQGKKDPAVKAVRTNLARHLKFEKRTSGRKSAMVSLVRHGQVAGENR